MVNAHHADSYKNRYYIVVPWRRWRIKAQALGLPCVRKLTTYPTQNSSAPRSVFTAQGESVWPACEHVSVGARLELRADGTSTARRRRGRPTLFAHAASILSPLLHVGSCVADDTSRHERQRIHRSAHRGRLDANLQLSGNTARSRSITPARRAANRG